MQAPASAERRAAYYRTYVLAVLSAGYLINFIDRQIVATLMPLIKVEFILTDFQLGLLVGPVFGTFLAIAGVPIALVGDRLNRRNIIAVSILVFSGLTIVCGFVTSFWQLILARLLTGIGSAGTTPPSTSMLADLFPREKRATAMALFTIGANIGLFASILGGGYVATYIGWREAMIWAGLPGLFLAVLMVLTVREPVRGTADSFVDTSEKPPVGKVFSTLWKVPAFRNVTLGTACCSVAGFGTLVFTPLFFMRTHHMELKDISVIIAVLWGIAGGCGSFFGGKLADIRSRKDITGLTSTATLVSLIPVPFIPTAFLSPDTNIALLALIPLGTLTGAYAPVCYAAVAALSPLRMRATATALFLLVVTLAGSAAAPAFFGWLSDLFGKSFGTDGLRYALLFIAPFWAAGAFFYWRAGKTLKADIAKAS